MNSDREMKLMNELAATFLNASRPNHCRIEASSLDFHFIDFQISEESLTKEGFKHGAGYYVDDEGLRLSFNTTRRIIFSKGKPEVVNSFEFIDSVYQMFCRYELAMMHRNMRKTHWTLVERVGKFGDALRPHEKKSFRIMDVQPRVYTIMVGTRVSIATRLRRYRDAVGDKKIFSSEKIVPIFEAMVSSVQEELNAIIQHIDQHYAQPYRESQLGSLDGDGAEITRLTRTKQCIKHSKGSFLIDPSQDFYTPKMLVEHIEHVRMSLKRGQVTHVDTQPGVENTTSIEQFIRTKGEFFDDLCAIKLHPYRDDVSVIEVDESMVFESAESRSSTQTASTPSTSTETSRSASTMSTPFGSSQSMGVDLSELTRRMRSETQDTSFSSVIDGRVDDDYEEEKNFEAGQESDADDENYSESEHENDTDKELDEEDDAPKPPLAAPKPPLSRSRSASTNQHTRARSASTNPPVRTNRRDRSVSTSQLLASRKSPPMVPPVAQPVAEAGESDVSVDSD
jgi:hypothetical protein